MKLLNKIEIKEALNGTNEFPNEAVPKHKLKSIGSFIGVVIGEHTTATEFVIGPLFVLHGASVSDVFLGLLLGNLMAMLSWALICAPVAVKTRHTIHIELRRIAGTGLLTIYNIIKAMMFCVVVSATLIVSASAVGPFLGVTPPGLTDLHISSFNWVWLILAVGTVVMFISVLGFDYIVKFANVFAPWIPLVFIGSGIAILPKLGVHNLEDFWRVANESIWTGNPVTKETNYSLIHIFIFSWLCNSTMHLGLSDMSIYRFAKKSSYGFISGLGVYIGHLLTWLSSGILCAVAIKQGNNNPSPGELAYLGAGFTGIVCVIFSGFTSAVPTMYRVGLAVQSSLKRFKFWQITLCMSIISIVLACFPVVVAKLDHILGIGALILSPLGAVIFADHFILPKLGLKTFGAERDKIYINPPVMSAWIGSVSISYVIFNFLGLDYYFFVAFPCWVFCLFLYVGLTHIQQKYMVKKPSFDVYVKNNDKVMME
ncbi:hypothetical protein MY04_5289 [Flammeovirga sp. MY04]|uniref:purine-cytosine permease family protein n=1 Tax=Flammeovirga sp. MY04 TaxID=1191459 RepID=UPI000A0617BA|nr:hypothetical protein [Flammeovirga sp. MY04]ANQ52621.2 hypothetical protein MY04_5289 [Flammeovirga sp. MY04]